MKKVLVISLVSLLFISAAMAKSGFSGKITLPDGSTTIAVTVGSSDHNLAQRVRNLEQAVRDLQKIVYDLQDDQLEPVWVCQVRAFSKTFFGEAASKAEATKQAIVNCEKEYSAMFCDEVTCSNE